MIRYITANFLEISIVTAILMCLFAFSFKLFAEGYDIICHTRVMQTNNAQDVQVIRLAQDD